ncbi:MAG: alanine racemase [Elusimicrobiota bacterium]
MLRPTFAEVDLQAVKNNFQMVKDITGTKIMPVIKADAYGHGAVKVGKVLEQAGADILGVATIEEGIELRENSIEMPILILGSIYPFKNYREVFKYNLTPIVASEKSAENLAKVAREKNKEIGFHLKVDTGMGRIGVSPPAAVNLWDKLLENSRLIPQGIFTHLAKADEDPGFTKKQIRKFRHILNELDELPPFVHAANTAGIMNFDESLFNLVRPGLFIYGLYPDNVSRKKYSLDPVMRWNSSIIYLKEVSKGTPVSYGGTWVAPRKSKVATLCVGYADGYPRLLSNKSEVIIAGKRAPVIGRVCMDMIMVDVTGIEGVEIGDRAILLGKAEEDSITAEELAAQAQTINYEITTGISDRVPREYVGTL